MSVTSGAATVLKLVFTGLNSTGTIDAPGLEVGDKVISGTITGSTYTVPTDWSPFSGAFEPTVTVADQFQVILDYELEVLEFTVYFIRGV